MSDAANQMERAAQHCSRIAKMRLLLVKTKSAFLVDWKQVNPAVLATRAEATSWSAITTFVQNVVRRGIHAASRDPQNATTVLMYVETIAACSVPATLAASVVPEMFHVLVRETLQNASMTRVCHVVVRMRPAVKPYSLHVQTAQHATITRSARANDFS